ncbi:hypothetical protein [Ramlibacter sp.]|uniref:hypothetical protein n=1 Tax=Ramlibacter sp. TaxID=1917967 RepID=UPI002C0121A7|nr:hypothetical protein [Ramlibacter sp.]HWI82405.1 hypothetical protein [Ramlibacter sp.]
MREFIDQDLERFRSDAAGLKIGAAPKMRTADGKSVESHWLAPAERGQWERVAYFEEGDYYMAFVVSSRTEQGLLDAMPAFEELVGGYRE